MPVIQRTARCQISFLAFPLRLDGAFLKRTQEPQAILQLIDLMARTPASSWAGCSSFGVRNYFERMRLAPDGLNQATKAINSALQDLEINRYRVQSIAKEPSGNPDVDNYVLTLVDTSDSSVTFSQRIGAA